jgi:cell division protein FtsB
MPQTREYWEKRADMDQALILKQRDEIGRLKYKVNQLEQKVKKLKT